MKEHNEHVGKKVATMYSKDACYFMHYIFKCFGFEPIYLDGPAEKELKVISKYLSEEWCFPLKMLAADLYKGLLLGADVIVGPSSEFVLFIGPCKMPYIMKYKMEHILKKAYTEREFSYHIFSFVPPNTFASMLKILSQLGIDMRNPKNLVRLKRAFKAGLRRSAEANKLENVMRKVRARAVNPRLPIEVYNHAMDIYQDIYVEKEWVKFSKLTQKKLLEIPQDKDKKILRIGIIGDYYSIAGNFPQFDIENFLSKKFSVECIQTYSFGDSRLIKKNKKHQKKRKEYNKYWVGGSDFITSESIFELQDMKVDGMIHLKAFACAPEDMMTLVIEEMKKKEKELPPILSLTFDEHSSTEGLKTRMEAFCNTLMIKKQ